MLPFLRLLFVLIFVSFYRVLCYKNDIIFYPNDGQLASLIRTNSSFLFTKKEKFG